MRTTSIRAMAMAALLLGFSVAVGGDSLAAQAAGPGRAVANAKDVHDGPWLGTWQRRNSSPNQDVWILKMWKEDDGIRYTINVRRPDGTPTPTEMGAFVRFDGKPYPEKGNASADHNVFDRLDDHTLRLTDVKDGQKTIQFTITYSEDGKVRTSVSERTGPDGKAVTSTGVWDRVG